MKHLLNFAFSMTLLFLLVCILILPILASSLWRWEKPKAKIIDNLVESVNLITRVANAR